MDGNINQGTRFIALLSHFHRDCGLSWRSTIKRNSSGLPFSSQLILSNKMFSLCKNKVS